MKNEISSIYKEIKSLKLKEDLISPISYCIAYDLIKRYQEFEQNRKIKVESILEKKEVKKEEKKKEIREKQETSTLNWIERRITSSLMRINSPGINPNQLYWQEKDTKTATDNIKLHSELKGKDITDLFVEYFLFAIEKIQSQSKIPVPKINEVISDITEIIEKELKKRLAHSASKEERNYMLEGERYQIAKQLAVKIGKLLDKALYDKFKNRN